MNYAIGAAVVLAAALGGSVVTLEVQQKIGQTERFPQFDNDEVKVWKTVIQTNQPLAMHHHDQRMLSGGVEGLGQKRFDLHAVDTLKGERLHRREFLG